MADFVCLFFVVVVVILSLGSSCCQDPSSAGSEFACDGIRLETAK